MITHFCQVFFNPFKSPEATVKFFALRTHETNIIPFEPINHFIIILAKRMVFTTTKTIDFYCSEVVTAQLLISNETVE